MYIYIIYIDKDTQIYWPTTKRHQWNSGHTSKEQETDTSIAEMFILFQRHYPHLQRVGSKRQDIMKKMKS